MTTSTITFNQVLLLAQELPPIEQARLVARLAPQVEHVIASVMSSAPISLRGLFADLGTAPSAQEMETVRREMWAGLEG